MKTIIVVNLVREEERKTVKEILNLGGKYFPGGKDYIEIEKSGAGKSESVRLYPKDFEELYERKKAINNS